MSLWDNAPNKPALFGVGDLNNWSLDEKSQMNKAGDYWWVTISDLKEGEEYAFQYLVNNPDGSSSYVADPYSEKVLCPEDEWISSSTYPNLKQYPAKAQDYVTVIKTGNKKFDWKYDNFKIKNPADLSIYAVNLLDFPEGAL